ncbi:MAG: hypothetical protein WD229_03255 [Pirellulales bacterium]
MSRAGIGYSSKNEDEAVVAGHFSVCRKTPLPRAEFWWQSLNCGTGMGFFTWSTRELSLRSAVMSLDKRRLTIAGADHPDPMAERGTDPIDDVQRSAPPFVCPIIFIAVPRRPIEAPRQAGPY